MINTTRTSFLPVSYCQYSSCLYCSTRNCCFLPRLVRNVTPLAVDNVLADLDQPHALRASCDLAAGLKSRGTVIPKITIHLHGSVRTVVPYISVQGGPRKPFRARNFPTGKKMKIILIGGKTLVGRCRQPREAIC